MYPNQFEYLAPTTLDEALSVLAERGDEIKVSPGETYYFCAPGCKSAFEKDPSALLATEAI